jgi:hypothetical protein
VKAGFHISEGAGKRVREGGAGVVMLRWGVLASGVPKNEFW